MAYETGTATNLADLLTKLQAFATAQGWTIHFAGARTSGTGNALQLSKAGHAATFFSDTATPATPFLGVYAHDAYSAGNGTENQANGSAKCQTNRMSGPFQAYHFFAGNTYLYVVVETTAGVFKHAGTGVLIKFGAFNTGAFAYGCNWNYNATSNIISNEQDPSHAVPFDSLEDASPWGTAFRADSDGFVPRWFLSAGGTSTHEFWGGIRPTGASGFNRMLNVAHSPSEFTQRAALQPCLLGAVRSGNVSLVGYPPAVRWVNMTPFAPGDLLTIGGQQWKVFPVIRKNGVVGEPDSASYGYAFQL